MIWSTENARRVLDRLCEHPSVNAAAKMLGGSSKLIWVWAHHSARDKANDVEGSKYRISGWPDEDSEPMWFHEAVDLSRKIHALNLDADTRELLNGIERPVVENGAFCYAVDSKAIALFDNKRDAEDFGGYTDWPYLHNEDGSRVVLTIKEHVPAQLKIHALKSLMGSIWNPPERSETDVKHSGGVLVLHGNRAKPKASDTPLVQDLRSRLATIRANPDRATAKPNAPVQIMGRGDGGPPEKVSQPSDDVQPDLHNHPRAYTVPTPQPPKQEPVSYARPTRDLNAEDRPRGQMPAGGFAMTTGRAT
jgi:hypothetical protein